MRQNPTISYASYARNDSVFYRRSLTASPVYWDTEKYIDGNPTSSASTPSLRMCYGYVGIVYDVLASGTHRVVLRYNDNYGDAGAWHSAILLKTLGANSRFLPTPVLAPFYYNSCYGFVTAWSQDSMIGMRPVRVDTLQLGAYLSPMLDARTNIEHFMIVDTSAGFPSIMEDTSRNAFGLAFQQRRAANASQIFFAPVTLSITGSAPTITLSHGTPEWVSKATGGDCTNEHPSLDRGTASVVSITQSIRRHASRYPLHGALGECCGHDNGQCR